jgi:hypothetical protein
MMGTKNRKAMQVFYFHGGGTMEISLFTEPEKEFQLTTRSSQSHYGLPVLRIEGGDSYTDYGPADYVFPRDGLVVP